MRILLVFCFFLTQLAFAQKNETWLEGRMKAGFLIAHRSIMGHIPNEHAFAGEFSYLFQSKGEKDWHSAYNYPTYGVTAFIGSVGNRDLLGYYYGSYGFAQFPLVKKSFYCMSFKIGTGAAYAPKVYDPASNILSIPIGSHLNAMIVLGINSRFVFNDHSFSVALDLTHFSAGATKIPNLGLNLPYVSLGYGYRLQQSTFCDTCSRIGLAKHTYEFGAMAFGSMKEIEPIGGRKYPVVGLNLIGRKYFGPKAGLEVSFDMIYKEAIYGFKPDISKTAGEIVQLGLFTGYLLPLDHLHMVVGMGVYVRDKFQPEDFLYHRLGIRYVFDNGINLGATLKTHWARADYIEYGIGYTFKR